MIKRSLLLAVVALGLLLPLCAGDVATFVNLGFSPDSAYFMFGQYGAETATGKPYAELYLVDTKKNAFVPKGSLRKVFDTGLEAGQDQEGALFSLFGDALPLAASLKIDHLATGRLLYILLDGEEPPATISFRDFKTDRSYEIVMSKSLGEDGSGPISSFGLSVSRTEKDGSPRNVSAGNPSIKRSGVRDYVIRRIIIAPDEKTLVIIVEKRILEKNESSVRFMVETLSLP
jgi:predicted secreted protein